MMRPVYIAVGILFILSSSLSASMTMSFDPCRDDARQIVAAWGPTLADTLQGQAAAHSKAGSAHCRVASHIIAISGRRSDELLAMSRKEPFLIPSRSRIDGTDPDPLLTPPRA